MTAGIITPISSGRNAKTVQSKANADSSGNFLDVFKASAGNSGNSEKLGDDAFKVEGSKKVQKKADKKVSESKKDVESKQPKSQEDDIENKAKKVDEAVENAVSAMAQILDTSIQDIQDALEVLEFDEVDLLDSANISEIVVEVTGASDVVDIMTDEALFTDVKEIMQEVDGLSAELADELGVSVDELNEAAKSIMDEAQSQAEVLSTVKTSDESDGDETAGDGTDNGQMNFTQTFVENIREAAQKADNVEAGYATDMNEIYNQVSESLKVNMTEDITEMEMNLHPASLGNVKIHIAKRDGMITASFTTQNEQVKAALETQIVELKESMNEQGIKVENIEITLASHAFEENLSKEGEQTSSGSEEKKKRRSINLNELEEIDDINIEDDIRIAREMMMHNGTTVDYMA